MITVGLDPSLNSIGVAILHDHELVDCFRFKVPSKLRGVKATTLEIGDRVREVGNNLVHAIGHRRPFTEHWSASSSFGPYDCSPVEMCPSYEGQCQLDGVDALVYEWPQIYGVGVSRVDPNDLPPLAAIGAHVAARIPTEATVQSPKPAEWSGGTSKNTDEPYNSSRWKRLEQILTPREIKLVPEEHDVIDAVGLALHATPRSLATPRRKFPGASPRRA